MSKLNPNDINTKFDSDLKLNARQIFQYFKN